MERREALYRGANDLRPLVPRDKKTRAYHVRNLCAEFIEDQVTSGIPQPKVSAMRREDEPKAKLIEDMLRSELDRLPFERMNDLLSRTVPIQGGAGILLEWDSAKLSHSAAGELAVSPVHPRQLIPQEGVTELGDMDWFILKLPQTREGIRRSYGISVEDEANTEPELWPESDAPDAVTQYTAYYRNASGGIGLFSWVGDTVLADYEDYQARQPVGETTGFARRSDGSTVPLSALPPYVPGVYPLFLIRNVSVYGKLLGESDVDKIADQQNTTNRIEGKIIDKLLRSGSYITLPDDASIRVDAEDMKVIRPGSAADKALIGVYDLQGDIAQDMAFLKQVYEEARQAIGITDSLLGRYDSTAESGVAKRFAAAQAAGRLESKRVMREAAYAELFEAMFRFRLAYADEPRPVVSGAGQENPVYEEFNRYDFLEEDDAGQLWWNDRFLFSCDRSETTEANREVMWEETRRNLQSGAFGDPTDPDTLILFWSRMEQLHYPNAGATKSFLLRRKTDLRRGEAHSP